MRDTQKYKGVIPALYACYEDNGEVSGARTQELVKFLASKGVKGLYVNGSSGECIYQSVAERKLILENVMKVRGNLTIIAHVACNNTADSAELAAHAEKLGVEAIAAIPPIYFHLPDFSMADYWNTISAAAPNTDFFIYNIPALAGVALSRSLYQEMLKNPCVAGVKNSSAATQDIQIFKAMGGNDRAVFNCPDEQFVSGLAMGADGGIGGTYSAMPELFVKAYELVKSGKVEQATEIQYAICEIIESFFTCRGNMYAVIKEILRRKDGINIGDVRRPLSSLTPEDGIKVDYCVSLIKSAVSKYTK